jgi:hypothetical protein
MGDYHRVVSMLLTDKKYLDALAVVQDAPFEKINNFVYKVAPTFMEVIPEKAVQTFLSKSQLQVSDLIPALMRYISMLDVRIKEKQVSKNELETNFAIYYLEEYFRRIGIIFENSVENSDMFYEGNQSNNIDLEAWVRSEADPVAIHLLCHLYAKYDKAKDEKKLCDFLQIMLHLQELNALTDLFPVDIEYLHRQCRLFGRKRGSIYVQLLLRNFLSSVREALTVEMQLAKTIARRQNDPELRKTLWLEIAVASIAKESDMKKAVALVKESNDDLKIEVRN